MFYTNKRKTTLKLFILMLLSTQSIFAKAQIIDHLAKDSYTRTIFNNKGIILDSDINDYKGNFYISHNPIRSQPEADLKEKLSDFLNHIKQINATLSIDIKPASVQSYVKNIIQTVNNQGLNDNVFYWVRNISQAQYIHENFPQATIFYWAGDRVALEDIIYQLENSNQKYGISTIGTYETYYSTDTIQKIKNLNLKLAMQGYNSSFIDNIDYLISDNPIQILQAYPNKITTQANNVVVAPQIEVKAPQIQRTFSEELIFEGGINNRDISSYAWSTYGETYGVRTRNYNGRKFLYATPKKEKLGGLSIDFPTEIGKKYQVSAILLGTDTNRDENFNGASQLTVSNDFPTVEGSHIIKKSEKIYGGEETTVSFTFTASSNTSYLALRSDAQWHYANARAISVKEIIEE